MKILIVSNLYPSSPTPEYKPGVMLLHQYATYWKKDHEVVVINPHSYNILTYRKLCKLNLSPSFHLNGIEVQNEPVLRLPGDSLQIRKFWSLIKTYSIKFDCIIGCLPVGVEIAYFLSKQLKIPFFAYLHITDFHRSGVSKGKITSKYRGFLKAAEGLLYISHQLKKEFENLGVNSQKGMILPGAISKRWLNLQLSKDYKHNGTLKLITIARLIRRKNIDAVLEGLVNLKDVDFSYTIVGEGDCRDQLENIVSANPQLDQRVCFTGKLDREQLIKHYDENDFMILTSTNESFGLVYLEAMARGCLPIGTIGEGIDGVIEHNKNGFLCEPNSDSISKILLEVANLSQRKMRVLSESAIETAQNFTYKSLGASAIRFISSRL